jgi:PAS domain S-box-containing protein
MSEPEESGTQTATENLVVLPEPALMEAEARNPELFEHAPDIVYSHDLEGNLTSINRAAARMTGYTVEEITAMSIRGIVAPEYRDLARQMIMRKLAGEKVTTYELEIVKKDGGRVPIEINSWLIHQDGQPVGIQGIGRDITERRKAETLAQDSERRFRVLFEHSSDAIMLWSAQGRVLYATPSVERVLGYSEPQIMGRIAMELVHPDDTDQARRLWQEAMKEPGNVAGGLFRVRHMDGTWRWIEGVAKNLLKERGVEALVATFRDVTERVRTQQELQDSVRLLESAYSDRRALMARLVNAQEEERERIAQDIHDDSIQGLTAALINLETLRGHMADPKQLALCEQLIASVRRSIASLRSLIFQVHPHALDEYGIEPAIRQLLERAREEIGLEFDVVGGLTEEPSTETRQIVFRIAQEALTNVLKHARAKKVEITFETVDDGTRVQVKDDGLGFSSNGHSEPGPGHLGLAGMRARAHSAGGWCKVVSTPGDGTVVDYWLPEQSATEPAKN